MRVPRLFFLIPLASLFTITGCSNLNQGNVSDSSNLEELKNTKLAIRNFNNELGLITKELELLQKKNLSKVKKNYTESDNIYCERNLKSSVTRVDKSFVPDGYGDLDDYQLTADFRRPGKKFPYSEALAYNDPVTGESIAVRDQNFIPGGSKVFSSWGRFNIALGGYWKFVEGGFMSPTFVTFIPFEANILFIPDGEKFLIVKGCNGRFKVTSEIANALLKQDDSKNAYIRFSTENNGSAHLSEVGSDTVKAWKKVYAKWEPAKKVEIEDIGF